MPGSTRWILWSRDEPGEPEVPSRPDKAASAARPVGNTSPHAVTLDEETPFDDETRPLDGSPPFDKASVGRTSEFRPNESRALVKPVRGEQSDNVHPTDRRPAIGGRRGGGTRSDINAIIDERSVGVVFQPILDVENDQVIGFEALARGPEGALASPVHLFAAARAAGRAGELDWVCRALAFDRFMAADLPGSMSLFVNVEPDSLIEPCPEDLLSTIWEAETRLRVFVDIPGRALSRHPREVLQTVRRARAARWGVAVDDTEFSSSGLALLPVVEPDVIRLHHEILGADAAMGAMALTAAISEMHHNDAALLVENVEDVAARRAGLGIGGVFQQGHLFGRAGPLPKRLATPRRTIRLLDHPDVAPHTPFSIVSASGSGTLRSMDSAAVTTLALSMAHQAANSNPVPVTAWLLPRPSESARAQEYLAQQFSYRMLLERTPLALLLGTDLRRYEEWNVSVADLPSRPGLADEMCLLLVSPTSCFALTAHPLGGSNPDRWEVALSQDPTVCRKVMRALLSTMDNMDGGVFHQPDVEWRNGDR